MLQTDDPTLDELVCHFDDGHTVMFVKLRVEEIITLSRQAMEAENNHPEPWYHFTASHLVCFSSIAIRSPV